MLFNGTQIEGTCEMVECDNELDTDEEYENMMAYGRPDYATHWLETTQNMHLLLEPNNV